MKKRLLSFSLVLICVCSFSLSAFAKNIENITDKDKAEIAQNPYLWYAKNQMLGVEDGTGVTLVCPNGDYSTLYTGGTLVSCPYDGEALVLASAGGVQAKKYETGGGSAGTGGVGRHPNGYADDTGTPSVGANGELQFTVYPDLFVNNRAFWNGSDFHPYTETFSFSDAFGSVVVSNLRAVVRKMSNSSTAKYYLALRYKFNAPVSGLYYLNGEQLVCSGLYNSNGVLRSVYFGHDKLNRSVSAGSNLSISDSNGFAYSTIIYKDGSQIPDTYTVRFYPLVVTCVPNSSSVNQTNNITINNNTWNGNIYQDNSTNLTYIYPQYTTINENNETVTNISNNPIIYNNETKQYYTYDTVTNNYYYITYEAPTPSPSPSPDPTPTPEPGGDTGDTNSLLDVLVQIRDNMIQGFADIKATLVQGWADLSANFTLAIENLNLNITNIFNKKFPDQSTPETAKPSPSPSPSPSPEPSPSPTPGPGVTPTPTPAPTDKPSGGNTNNFWNFVFPGGSDDGTENGHKGILWALISLLIAVVTFVLGLGSAYSYVFPFLPAGLVTTIHICVLVLLLFAIIKFVRSFL